MGLVADAFSEDSFKKLIGFNAIGHCRYSTTGESNVRNIQPICINYGRGSLALAHNGNLINAVSLRRKLEAEGSIFSSTSDSEVIVHLIARSKKKKFADALVDALKQIKGAYSLLVMTEDELFAVCDPYGIRPLSIATINGSWVFASETCAFDLVGAKYIRAVKPGEVVRVNKNGMSSISIGKTKRYGHCIFEFIYFSRPDSLIFDISVQEARDKLGMELFKEHPAIADIVIPVPDSSTSAAIGYSKASKIPFEMGLIRNHYIGRTFIEPEQSIRDFGAKIKYNPVKRLLDGKRIVVVDDSIVRGTTSRKIVKLLRKAGAKEIHWRISCPPITYPCFYGIDTPLRSELIGATHTVEEIRKYLHVESLGYLSAEGLLRSVNGNKNQYCLACFNGDYPLKN